MKFDIIIIGGGAAGLLAAGSAAESGANVLLLEKMKQTGRKIGISGKGRCNITNSAELSDFITHFGKNGKFLRSSFNTFFSDELIDLLQENGVPTVLERGGRYFPESGKALDIVRALTHWVKSSGATIKTSCPVISINQTEDHFQVTTEQDIFTAEKVIITTGGASYPRTGSTGDGYAFAKSLGHTIRPIQPALVPLTSTDWFIQKLDKLDLRNITCNLHVNGKRKTHFFGEMSFNQTGITGPTVLSISNDAVLALSNQERVEIVIDLKPALDHKKLDARLIRDLTTRHKESIESVLGGLLPRKLVPVCLELCQIAPQTNAGTFPAQLRKKLVHWLKNFTVNIDGHRPFDEAIITSGGVLLKEVNPTTLESRKVKGLYIAGELLDLQADTGGFNLQAAFSTGWLAGRSAAKTI